MEIKPLYDRVIIQPEVAEAKTGFGIILPESAQEKSQIGEVVAVGNGGSLDGNDHKMQLQKGDRVLYSRYAGTEIKIDNKDLIVVRQTDVLAVLGGKNG